VERADVGKVEETPQQGGDHAGDGVGQEDHQAAEAAPGHPLGVQQQREQQREAQHGGDHDHPVGQDADRPVEQFGVAEGVGVVAEAGPHLLPGAAAQAQSLDLDPAQAEVDGVADGQREEEREEHDGGDQEEVRGSPLRPVRSPPAGRPRPSRDGRRHGYSATWKP
jgi:hypothetical protein